jgi:CheY-like chemotaxis protein
MLLLALSAIDGGVMSDSTLKILVADDSAAIHNFFAAAAQLSPIPFDIVTAETGRQCMELLNGGRFNLAFIDINMPEMSGMEAIGVARHGGDRTFAVLMSSNASEQRRELARLLKVYDFLVKPFSTDAVLGVLKTYCRVTASTRVLIVDDSATVRRIVHKVLSGSIFNIEATEVDNGQAALSCCGTDKFDVVFLDCNMPGLDGLQTLDRLIARDQPAKVIMISSQRNEERERSARQRGAVAFLHKPFYPRDVDRVMHALFGLNMPVLANVAPGQNVAERVPA